MSHLHRIFVRDLEVSALVGVHSHERTTPQPVRINLDLYVDLAAPHAGGDFDTIDQVVDYAQVAAGVRALARLKHVALIETLAEQFAALCLEDRRVVRVRVKVEKPDALEHAASAGVEIERCNRRTYKSPRLPRVLAAGQGLQPS